MSLMNSLKRVSFAVLFAVVCIFSANAIGQQTIEITKDDLVRSIALEIPTAQLDLSQRVVLVQSLDNTPLELAELRIDGSPSWMRKNNKITERENVGSWYYDSQTSTLRIDIGKLIDSVGSAQAIELRVIPQKLATGFSCKVFQTANFAANQLESRIEAAEFTIVLKETE